MESLRHTIIGRGIERHLVRVDDGKVRTTFNILHEDGTRLPVHGGEPDI